jgi:hypothetical protein
MYLLLWSPKSISCSCSAFKISSTPMSNPELLDFDFSACSRFDTFDCFDLSPSSSISISHNDFPTKQGSSNL